MSEFFGGTFVLLGLAIMGVSLIAVIKPLPKLKLPTRGRAALGLIGGFLVMMVGGAILPQPPASTETAVPTASAAPSESLRPETEALWLQIKEQVSGCDTASVATANAFDKSQDVYELYGVVTDAKERCKDSWRGLGVLRVPASARGEIKKGLDDALQGCSTAYYMKYTAYENMAKVLDGDTRPSAVANAKSSMQDATGAQIVCVAGFMTAAEKAGVPMAEFAKADS